MFYKVYKNKSPKNLFKLIPEKKSSYGTRNGNVISFIKIKDNFLPITEQATPIHKIYETKSSFHVK